ncbi:hypothetical protein V7O66_03380 [Methanolobus sp. ZRKC3]|uniref:hypothetical protein n=1 Tax=Methanolobus sp. ZRKC3 TaxID=3125786 RepID=UPI0032466CD1
MNRLSLFFLSILLLSSIASASNVTFSDLDMGGAKEIMIYKAESATGQPVLIGTFNSTDSIELDSSYDYLIVFQPGIDYWYSNPLNSLDLFNRETPSLLSFVAFFVVIVGVSKIIFR